MWSRLASSLGGRTGAGIRPRGSWPTPPTTPSPASAAVAPLLLPLGRPYGSDRADPPPPPPSPLGVSSSALQRRLADSASLSSHGGALRPDQTQFSGSPYPTQIEEAHRVQQRLDASDEPLPDTSAPPDDSTNSVLLFPGQGTLRVGQLGPLVSALPNVRAMLERASHAMDKDLLGVCLDGPQELLDQTLYNQPATVVASLATVEKLYSEDPSAVERCVATAGFSVGEVTALIFSGALTFDEGIRLVNMRAEAMHYCCEVQPSGMMTVFYGRDQKLALACQVAKKWIEDKNGVNAPVCQVATHLYAGAKVIAGNEEALQFIEENKSDFKIRRTKRLPVSGAFHTDLMRPAGGVLQEALKSSPVHTPRIPVYSNLNMKIYNSQRSIRQWLPKQVYQTVRWEQEMALMFGVYKNEPAYMPRVFECGPGDGQLKGILRKINGKVGKRTSVVELEEEGTNQDDDGAGAK